MVLHHNPRDRQAAEAWARGLLELDDFYVLDTETTGIREFDEIIQIGLIDKHGTTMMETLVKSQTPVPAAAIGIHGITNYELADAPSFANIYEEFAELLCGQVIVAYNIDFDWRLVQQTTSLYQLEIPSTKERHCAMRWYAKYYGAWNRRRRQYRWQRLSDASVQQKIPVENAHSAVGDCLMTLALIQKMAE